MLQDTVREATKDLPRIGSANDLCDSLQYRAKEAVIIYQPEDVEGPTRKTVTVLGVADDGRRLIVFDEMRTPLPIHAIPLHTVFDYTQLTNR